MPVTSVVLRVSDYSEVCPVLSRYINHIRGHCGDSDVFSSLEAQPGPGILKRYGEGLLSEFMNMLKSDWLVWLPMKERSQAIGHQLPESSYTAQRSFSLALFQRKDALMNSYSHK